MALYDYTGNYPDEKKTGWAGNVQGLCHDEKNWYISQSGELWKIPVSHDLEKKIDKNPPLGYLHKNNSETGLKKTLYDHYGDIDYSNGYLFIPITSSDNDVKPAIAVFNANTLTYVCRQVIKRNDGKQYYKSLPWCAVHNGKLYTSDRHCGLNEEEDSSPIEVYNIDFNAIKEKKNKFLKYDSSFPLWNNPKSQKSFMQGGCFDDSGRLHVNSGMCPSNTSEGFSSAFLIKNFSNTNDGIQVFSLSRYVSIFAITILKRKYGDNIPYEQLLSHSTTLATEVARSCMDDNKNNRFRYEFHPNSPKYEEPEGITFWDLRGMTNIPEKIRNTVFHALMLDNEANNNDEVYMKHYRYE